MLDRQELYDSALSGITAKRLQEEGRRQEIVQASANPAVMLLRYVLPQARIYAKIGETIPHRRRKFHPHSTSCASSIVSIVQQLPRQQHRKDGTRTKEASEAAVGAIALAARQAERCIRSQGQPGSAQVEGLHALDRLHSESV